MNSLALASIETFKDQILHCDAETLLRSLPVESVDCIVTSPPYFALRSYLPDDHPDKLHEIGLESLHDCLAWAKGKRPCNRCFVCAMRKVFAGCYRVLKSTGVMWVNLGDSYSGSGKEPNNWTPAGRKQSTNQGSLIPLRTVTPLKNKNLIGIPWRVALALQADGWILRSDIIWAKPNPMPEGVKDRCTKSHEYVFMFAKSGRYFYDQDAIREEAQDWGSRDRTEGKYTSGEPGIVSGTHHGLTDGDFSERGKNKRDVWQVTPEPFPEAHFATFPTKLIEPMILAGCPPHVCTACGKPHQRIVEKEFIPQEDVSAERVAYRGKMADENHWKGFPRGSNRISSSEFKPVCKCGADSEPGIVLDPFMGSGTTAVVAVENGRRFIGSDLNPEYIKIAEGRIKKTYRVILEKAIAEITQGLEKRNADPFQKTIIEVGSDESKEIVTQASLFQEVQS